MLEGLERRYLLAATINVNSGRLTVTGSNSANDIEIYKDGANHVVVADGATSTITRSLSQITVNGKGGNDRIVIRDSVLLPVKIEGGDGDDFMRGGSGADSFAGGKGTDTVSYFDRAGGVIVDIDGNDDDGAPGEDDNVRSDVENLEGGDGNDRLTGSLLGHNQLSGLGGDDVLRGLLGNDDYIGGAGFDTVDFSGPVFFLRLHISIDDVANDGLRLGTILQEYDNVRTDIEGVIGSDGPDMITSFADAVGRKIEGNGGDDTVATGDGDDTVTGGTGDDLLNAGEGNNNVQGNSGSDTIMTGGAADTIVGGDDDLAMTHFWFPPPSPDEMDDDLITAGDGENKISGGGGGDTIITGAGKDDVSGGTGNDDISTDGENDDIDAGGGNDTVSAGDGDDTIEGGLGFDNVNGDGGNDTITDAGTGPAPLVTAAAEGEEDPTGQPGEPDVMYGGPGNDVMTASEGPAILIGEDGDDLLTGGAQGDILDGRDGDDTAVGGDGDDTIGGGFGNDEMSGGTGNDIFVNNDGESDTISGGDDIDFVQEEEGFVDFIDGDVETRFDTTEDGQNPEPTIGSTGGPDKLLGENPAPLISQAGEISLNSLNNGVLTISGTSNPDTIEVRQVGTLIEVYRNGAFEEDYFASNVDSVIVDVGGGNDNVRLETTSGTNSLLKPSTIVGGSGNDTLRGGGGADSIFGGTGNDSCLGAGNNDTLSGGDGNDVLNGGSPQLTTNDGRDVYQGGAGSGDYADYSVRQVNLTLRLDGIANDGQTGTSESENLPSDVEYLLGGTKNDLIVGNSLANLLSGGGGADTLKGGGGNDQLIASYTKDSLIDQVFGNSGNDYLFIQDTKQDRHSGIVGTDFFTPDAGVDVTIPDQT